MSCYSLWSYLASWGMLRGSSELLQKSPASLKSLVAHFDEIADSPIWSLDVPDYNKNYGVDGGECVKGIDIILKEYNRILDEILKILKDSIDEEKVQTEESGKGNDQDEPSRILVTKIMLGVFGVIPAFDSNFANTFCGLYPRNGFSVGYKKLTEKQLKCIHGFYKKNKGKIDLYKIPVKNFYGKNTGYEYKKAKLIDMYGFMCGRAEEQKKAKRHKK